MEALNSIVYYHQQRRQCMMKWISSAAITCCQAGSHRRGDLSPKLRRTRFCHCIYVLY